MNHGGTQQLETNRLLLRRFAISDAQGLYRNITSDLNVNDYLIREIHRDISETRALLKEWEGKYRIVKLKEIGTEENMRTLQEQDREEILCYVGKEPEMNLFFIGDIESFGVENETVNIYLHEERDRWDFLILRFHQYFLLYSRYEDYNAQEAIAFFRGQRPDCISGKTVLLEKIAPAFPQWTIESTYMSRCNRVEDRFSKLDGPVIRRLEKEDVAEAIDLLLTIQEFNRTYKKDERDEHIRRMVEEMARGSKVAVGGFLDGRLIAIASTSAENTESAMVVGVATAIDCRRKGYASAVVSALCRDCFERGKKYLCLFYDNPVAGRIYNRIGFQELGLYGMLR